MRISCWQFIARSTNDPHGFSYLSVVTPSDSKGSDERVQDNIGLSYTAERMLPDLHRLAARSCDTLLFAR